MSTSGYHACPRCGDSLVAIRPTHLKRVIYENHHCFLPDSHPKHRPSCIGIPLKSLSVGDWKEAWQQTSGNPPPQGMRRY